MANSFYDQFNEIYLGEDVVVTANDDGGDLVLGLEKELESVVGYNQLKQAIKRRLLTPKGALGRLVQDYSGIQVINTDYGNGAWKYVAEPLTAALPSNIKNEIRACLSKEDRIVINDITHEIVTEQNRLVLRFTISFIVKESNELLSLSFQRDSGGFTVQVM